MFFCKCLNQLILVAVELMISSEHMYSDICLCIDRCLCIDSRMAYSRMVRHEIGRKVLRGSCVHQLVWLIRLCVIHEFTQCRLDCAEPMKVWHTYTLERVTTILNNMKFDPTPDYLSVHSLNSSCLVCPLFV